MFAKGGGLRTGFLRTAGVRKVETPLSDIGFGFWNFLTEEKKAKKGGVV